MQCTLSSWISSLSKLTRRPRAFRAKNSRLKLVRRRHCFEQFERRDLLSGDGVFVRDDGITFVEGNIVALAGVYGHDTMNPPLSDDGDDPDYTYAYLEGSAQADDTVTDAHAEGHLVFSSLHPTAVGDSTVFPEAVANTHLHGDASAGNNTYASVESYGEALSWGEYLIDEETVPTENPTFVGHFKLQVPPPQAYESGESEIDIASGHYVSIRYFGPDGPDSGSEPDNGEWFIRAETARGLYPVQYPNTGDGLAKWVISYNLPDGYDLDHIGSPIGSEGDRLVEGALDIDIQFTWQYTTQEYVEISSEVTYEPYAELLGLSSPYGHAFVEGGIVDSCVLRF